MSLHKKTRVQSAKKVKEMQQQKKEEQLDKQSKNKSNIKVFTRLRQLNKREQDINEIESMKIVDTNTLYVMDYNEISGGKGKGSYFSFTGVYDKTIQNEEIYNVTTKPYISSILEGVCNGCVFAYGPTGTGKTFTMLGEGNQNAGVIPRALNDIILFRENKPLGMLKITISFVEIYMEAVRDLLEKKNNNSNNKILVREDPNKGCTLTSVSEVEINNIKEIYKLLLQGESNRTTDSTTENSSSSRSHALFIVYIENASQNNNTGVKETKFTKYVFADLAGSEKSMVSSESSNQNKNNKMKLNSLEGGNINRSLLYLGRCIQALVEVGQGGKGFIPWRESILTRLMKDSLEGDAKVSMICNISPSVMSLEESLNCLKYAQKACDIKSIKKNNTNNKLFNQDDSKKFTNYEDEILKYKNELEEVRTELANKIHSQHLNNATSMNSTQFPNKIDKLLKEIHSHFAEETANKNELISEQRKFELLKTELSIKEYLLFKIEHDNDNIVIENSILELKKKGVERVNIDKERESIKNIPDFRINHSMIINNSSKGFNNLQTSNVNNTQTNTNKNNSNYGNVSKQPNKNNLKNSFYNNIKINKSSDIQPHIKFNNNPYNPYDKNIPLKQNYNKNNKLSVKHVREITPGMYDYSDYKNPNIHHEKIRFNTKTSKIIEASQRGGLTELKMRVLDSMFPNSKVTFQYDNEKSRSKSPLKDSKINISKISDNSDRRLNSSQEERSIDKKIGKMLPNIFPKNVLTRYRASPYTNLPNI